MTAVPVDRPRRSLLGVVIGGLHARSRARTGQPSRLGLALKDHAMSFAAMAAVDVGMFRVAVWAGWVAVGVSLLLLDWKISG